jgi:FlaG/FlaF family flagellin (archaellin)
VTVIVEGKKYMALGQDCRAVSETIGQVLMIAVVILAFSSIALTVFSDDGAMNPPHVPRTDLEESIEGDNTVQIFHSGGEAIDLKEIKVILNIDGQEEEFNMSDPAVNIFDAEGNPLSSEDVFMLGDCIEINTSNSNVKLEGANTTELYFVHTASRQVVKKALLLKNGL